jgi:hypothetical protein
MASLIKLLSTEKHDLLVGEITGKSGGKYTVNLRDRTVAIQSLVDEELVIGTQVFVTNIEKELKIITKATVKAREQKEVLING